jgi:hypothetical protein
VFTSDPDQPWADTVVVDGEYIAFVGDETEALAHAGPDPAVVDVVGGVIMPGFVDAHAHVVMTGDALLKAQLRTATDLPELQRRLRNWADAHPDAPRILGVGWNYSAVPDGRPTREMLDAVSTDRPIYAEANDLHSSWVNTRALEELGIDAGTPDPIGGEIVRDPATGAATGHMQENANVTLVWPLLADVDDATRDQHLAAAIQAYNESGVTTAVDMAMGQYSLSAKCSAPTQPER